MAIVHQITLGDIKVLEVNADPSGVLSESKGTLALDSTNGKVYVCGGTTTWSELAAADLTLTKVWAMGS